MTNGEECDESSSLYKYGEGLTEFPANVDRCRTINLSTNNITSLRGVNASNCDALYASYNQITHLPADLRKGFPNLKFLNVSSNPITHVDPEILNSTVRIIILEYTKLRNISLDDAHENLSLYLAGTILRCDCSMKRARDRGQIRTAPRCSSGKTIQGSSGRIAMSSQRAKW